MENQIEIKEICPTTTQAWIKEGALLVDVREQNEVEQLAFNVPNLLHIPLSEFEERFNEIPKDKKVVLVCKSGGRSLRATGYLIHNGYDNVVNMKHGIIRWVQKGFPTKGNTAAVLGNTQDSGCCGSSAPKEASSSCCGDSSSNSTSCC